MAWRWSRSAVSLSDNIRRTFPTFLLFVWHVGLLASMAGHYANSRNEPPEWDLHLVTHVPRLGSGPRTRRRPRLRSAWVMPKPMPLDAPVTMATSCPGD